jgi:hypothetical protein
MHSRAQNNPHRKFKQLAPYSNIKGLFCKVFFFPYSHNLVTIYMECDYTCLNHNLLVSQKEVVTKGVIIRGFIVISFWLISLFIWEITSEFELSNDYLVVMSRSTCWQLVQGKLVPFFFIDGMQKKVGNVTS